MFFNELEKFKEKINNSIKKEIFSEKYEYLGNIIEEFLERGGKRLRPYLCFICYKAVGGKDEELAIKISCIPEIIHNGSLIIDDIEDKSDIRRGKPCSYKLYGISLSINAGNFMYFLPFKILREIKARKKILVKAYETLIKNMTEIHKGQALDIGWEEHKKMDISIDDYLKMVKYKTGAMARTSAELGALFGGGKKRQIKILGDFGETIGMAFQIQDDILNLAGDIKKYGKEIGGDITEGKRTLMVIHALKKANEQDKNLITGILNKHTKDEDEIKQAIEIIKKYKSIKYASRFAKRIVEKAKKKIAKSIPEGEYKEKLKEIADYVIKREL